MSDQARRKESEEPGRNRSLLHNVKRARIFASAPIQQAALSKRTVLWGL